VNEFYSLLTKALSGVGLIVGPSFIGVVLLTLDGKPKRIIYNIVIRLLSAAQPKVQFGDRAEGDGLSKHHL